MPLLTCLLNRSYVCFYRTLHSEVRVRFAPSPTGFLHLGGLRTAFYNYLYAKKNNGKFILRIEDTDQKRVKPGSVENLVAMLKWTGLFPDESPEIGGPFSPYIQSERLDIYKDNANTLLEKGAAYRCFCSERRLELLRKEAQHNRLNRGYDNKCRHLSPSEERKLLNEGKPFTIRFKIPIGPVVHSDVVYGESSYNISEIEGDFIILKSDGFPTYHFSCVVDDHYMKISHVLRGNEWLVSTPKHILMYQAFGWTPPKYGHLPLLVNSDRTKLSKRQESIGVEYYKYNMEERLKEILADWFQEPPFISSSQNNKGYFPESLLNFLAAAGGFGRQEGCFIYDMKTLCSKFELENMSTSSCVADLEKLDVFNRNYIINQLSNEETTSELIKKLRKVLEEKYGERYEMEKKNLPDSYILQILLLYKERLNNLHQFVDKDLEYLWTVPDLDNILKKLEDLNISVGIIKGWKSVMELLMSLPESEFTQENIAVKIREIITSQNIPLVPLFKSLRILLTGQKDGPGVAEILKMLGKDRSVSKINAVLEEIDRKRSFTAM